ncbi:MAG: hypothetical protein PSN04_00390 [Methyloprofundus sp.]|nr:hypothetical protein [Methyloprofundus sp.]
MRLSASGELKPQQKIINIQSATLNHLESSIHAEGNIAYQQDLQLNHATIDVHSKQLNKLSSTYLSPFIEGSELEGLSLTGELSTHLEIKNNALQHSKTQLNSVVINDSKQRFHAQNLAGTINWSPALSLQKTSSLNWQSLHIKGIPFDKGAIHFSVSTQHISLLNSPKLALLDGTLNIEQFEFKKNTHQGPTIHLRARLNDIALDKLSMAMGWENTLSGTMNGYIPSVTYQNKTLKLNGRLKMQLFDGEVTITQLASSGLFTDFSRFYITLDFDNLDLNQVTKKFKVGNIQGRLSGFAHDVYLENWQPVRFFAWLGTPENDSSKHLISHKAVRNIARLGGSNAADAISRGVLSWFDGFNYQQLGIGCYLHDGVCQLMGASAAKKGYYLVQGKSIPRIDIIGFNTRVDWHTLLNRLERITSPDEIIIDPSN